MKKRKLALLSIGQRPCLKKNDDMLTRLPEDIEIMQYGALDGRQRKPCRSLRSAYI